MTRAGIKSLTSWFLSFIFTEYNTVPLSQQYKVVHLFGNNSRKLYKRAYILFQSVAEICVKEWGWGDNGPLWQKLLCENVKINGSISIKWGIYSSPSPFPGYQISASVIILETLGHVEGLLAKAGV